MRGFDVCFPGLSDNLNTAGSSSRFGILCTIVSAFNPKGTFPAILIRLPLLTCYLPEAVVLTGAHDLIAFLDMQARVGTLVRGARVGLFMNPTRRSDTIVIQTFRSHAVPPWIQRCLDSVRKWAQLHGHEYSLAGDEFYNLCGPEYLTRGSKNPQALTNLARLVATRHDWMPATSA